MLSYLQKYQTRNIIMYLKNHFDIYSSMTFYILTIGIWQILYDKIGFWQITFWHFADTPPFFIFYESSTEHFIAWLIVWIAQIKAIKAAKPNTSET